MIFELGNISDLDSEISVIMKDDLGMGMVNIPTTLGGSMSQAHSQAIHHFACIGYMLHIHGVRLTSKTFGYNPATLTSKGV